MVFSREFCGNFSFCGGLGLTYHGAHDERDPTEESDSSLQVEAVPAPPDGAALTVVRLQILIRILLILPLLPRDGFRKN